MNTAKLKKVLLIGEFICKLLISCQEPTHFHSFLQYSTVSAVLKISAIVLKYSSFEGGLFSYFQGQNKYKIRLFVHSSVRTNKMTSNVRKPYIFALKLYYVLFWNDFLAKNRATKNWGYFCWLVSNQTEWILIFFQL